MGVAMGRRAAVISAAILVLCAPGPGVLAAEGSAKEQYEEGLAAYQRQDVLAAMQALEPAAARDYTPALVLLAHILDKANEDARAVDLYRRAAEKGDPEGELGLGGMYAAGEGVERDTDQARYWIERAARQGHGPAIVVLANAFAMGQLGLERDVARAREWLERGIESGYDPARLAMEGLESSAKKNSE